MMLRQPDWQPLQEVAVNSLVNEFQARFKRAPALRAWYLSRDQGETLQLRVSKPQAFADCVAVGIQISADRGGAS